MIKVLLFTFLSVNILLAQIVATQNIYYNDIVSLKNTKKVNIKNQNKSCKNINLVQLKKSRYQAVHYIRKGDIICQKDIKLANKGKIVYKFGDFLEIEEYGKVLKDTNKYIKIKMPNGQIKKIPKDEYRK